MDCTLPSYLDILVRHKKDKKETRDIYLVVNGPGFKNGQIQELNNELTRKMGNTNGIYIIDLHNYNWSSIDENWTIKYKACSIKEYYGNMYYRENKDRLYFPAEIDTFRLIALSLLQEITGGKFKQGIYIDFDTLSELKGPINRNIETPKGFLLHNITVSNECKLDFNIDGHKKHKETISKLDKGARELETQDYERFLKARPFVTQMQNDLIAVGNTKSVKEVLDIVKCNLRTNEELVEWVKDIISKSESLKRAKEEIESLLGNGIIGYPLNLSDGIECKFKLEKSVKEVDQEEIFKKCIPKKRFKKPDTSTKKSNKRRYKKSETPAKESKKELDQKCVSCEVLEIIFSNIEMIPNIGTLCKELLAHADTSTSARINKEYKGLEPSLSKFLHKLSKSISHNDHSTLRSECRHRLSTLLTNLTSTNNSLESISNSLKAYKENWKNIYIKLFAEKIKFYGGYWELTKGKNYTFEYDRNNSLITSTIGKCIENKPKFLLYKPKLYIPKKDKNSEFVNYIVRQKFERLSRLSGKLQGEETTSIMNEVGSFISGNNCVVNLNMAQMAMLQIITLTSITKLLKRYSFVENGGNKIFCMNNHNSWKKEDMKHPLNVPPISALGRNAIQENCENKVNCKDPLNRQPSIKRNATKSSEEISKRKRISDIKVSELYKQNVTK